MNTLMCPRCQTIKSMRETVSRRAETAADGKLIRIETRSFHCTTCSQFVKSEDFVDRKDREETPGRK